MANTTNHRVHVKHSRETRCLVTYLYNFCRSTDKICNRGFLTAKQIEKITGVAEQSVFRIARGYF